MFSTIVDDTSNVVIYFSFNIGSKAQDAKLILEDLYKDISGCFFNEDEDSNWLDIEFMDGGSNRTPSTDEQLFQSIKRIMRNR